jgi:hypothetical protein
MRHDCVRRKMKMSDYLIFGLRLRSSLPLPELSPWPGAPTGEVDVVVRESPVPEPSEETMLRGWSIDSSGALVLHIRDLVRMRISQGRSIELDILRRDPSESWRAYLLSSAFGALCHQRNLFPLHAASLRIGARTIAIAGPSGAGKSTLSFALTRRGGALLSDDLSVLQTGADGFTHLLPAFPRLKLWRDSLEAGGVQTDGLPRVAEGMDKYDLRPRHGFESAPRRLDGVLILAQGSEPSLRRLSKRDALPVLWANVFRRRVGALLGKREALFQQTGGIANTTAVYEFRRSKDFDSLDAGAALIEARFAAQA